MDADQQYDDPALRDLGAVPAKIGSLASLLVDTLPGGLKLFVYGARPEKLVKHVRLPQRMGPVLQKLEDVKRVTVREFINGSGGAFCSGAWN